MSDLVEWIKNNRNIILACVILALAIAFLFLFKKLFSKRQARKELSQAAEDRLRDDNLNQIILNHHEGDAFSKEIYKPYEVDYGSPNGKTTEDNASGGEGHVMLQLVERTVLSTRKFMMNPMKTIRIGSDLQANDISVLAEGISPQQCEIFSVRDKVFIRNLSSENRTIIKRKKEQAIVDEKGIRILSGDVIILGQVSYDIMIIN